MAHILMAIAPVESHFSPVASVARELVNRGHTVWWYAGKVFQPKIERLGAIYKKNAENPCAETVLYPEQFQLYFRQGMNASCSLEAAMI